MLSSALETFIRAAVVGGLLGFAHRTGLRLQRVREARRSEELKIEAV